MLVRNYWFSLSSVLIQHNALQIALPFHLLLSSLTMKWRWIDTSKGSLSQETVTLILFNDILITNDTCKGCRCQENVTLISFYDILISIDMCKCCLAQDTVTFILFYDILITNDTCKGCLTRETVTLILFYDILKTNDTARLSGSGNRYTDHFLLEYYYIYT